MAKSKQEIEAIVEENINLVWYILNKYFPQYAHDEDTFQNGMIGLWKACISFDADISKFSTYASKCIVNQIKQGFRKSATAKLSNMTSQVDSVISYDAFITGNDEDTILYFLEDPQDHIEDHMTMAAFNEVVSTLDDMDRRIIDLRIQGLNQQDISKHVGLSQAHVSRRLTRIKNKVKKKFSY